MAKNEKTRQPERNTKTKPQKKIQNGDLVKVPDGYANAGQRVPYIGQNIEADQFRTTTTLTGEEIQVGVESKFTDLGFSTPINFGNRIVDITEAEFIRSREVEFEGKAFMPGARLYAFFDDVDVNADCAPDGGNFGDPLICDAKGSIRGVFLIPNRDGKRFKTGDRKFRLTTSPTNQTFPPPASWADAKYTARGYIDTKQETTYSTRLYKTETQSVSRNLGPIEMSDSTTRFEIQCPRDPVAQSFFVYEQNGCFITDVDIFFYSKDEVAPVILQIRPLDEGGNPSNKVLPFGEVVKDAEEVIVNVVDLVQGTLTVTGEGGPWDSNNQIQNKSGTTIISGVPISLSTNPPDDMIPTRFTFESPIYLAPNTSYCIVLIADSIKYNVWIAQSGPDVTGRDGVPAFRDPGEANQNIGTSDPISKDPYIQGVYFKSQNGISWTADQTIDLKFSVRKAVFDTSINGEVDFVNFELPTRRLPLDPIETLSGSSKIRVLHPNHGMPGGTPKSRVVLSGVAGGTNGIPLAVLNDADGHELESVELDYYIIDLGAGNEANATGRVGGTAVRATENKRFEELILLTTPLLLPGTDVTWSVKTTSSRGVHDSTTASYQVLPGRNLVPNTKVIFDRPMHISSAPNERNAGDSPPGPSQVLTNGLGDRKSLRLTAILSSTDPNVSPVIDSSRLSVALLNNRLDNPAGYIPLGSTIDPACVINQPFDNFVCVPTALPPAVASTAGLLHFNSSTGALTGTFSSVGTSLTGIGSKLLTEVEVGDVIKDQATGAERKIIAVNSNTSATIDLSFSPDLVGATLLAEPPPLKIKTADANTALHLSKLDIGKLVSVSGSGVTNRNFSDKYILEVNYTPNNTVNDIDLGAPALCEIVVDHRITDAAGIDPANVTIMQKDRYVDEIAPYGGSCASKYVSRKLVLSQPANSLKILFDANRDETCTIDVYYKLDLLDEPTNLDDINWILAEYNIDNGGELIPVVPEPNSDPSEFTAYECNLLDLPLFDGVQIKVVMRGGNPAKPPRIKNMKIIALEE